MKLLFGICNSEVLCKIIVTSKCRKLLGLKIQNSLVKTRNIFSAGIAPLQKARRSYCCKAGPAAKACMAKTSGANNFL